MSKQRFNYATSKTTFSITPLRVLLPLLGVLVGSLGANLTRVTAAELFVADRATNRILAFDEETGTFSRVLVDQGLDQPVALAMGPGGQLYVANLQLGNVLKVDPLSGQVSPFVSGIVGPGGLAYDETSDSLMVSELGNFDGELIFQYDADGNLIQTIGAGTGTTGRAGMAFDASGDLYVSNFTNESFSSGSILKFDSSNDFSSLGTFASGGGLNGANGMSFDNDGNLFVASLFSQSLVTFPPGGGLDSGMPFGANLAYPSGVTLGNDGNLLISSLGNDNPSDPIYGSFLFPGNITRYDSSTGETIGGEPFIQPLGDQLIADFVEDELVDQLDLDAWQVAFGVDDSADADGDSDSDGADFLTWQSNRGNLGQFQPTSMVLYEGLLVESLAVPEYSTIVLAMGALVCLSVIRCSPSKLLAR